LFPPGIGAGNGRPCRWLHYTTGDRIESWQRSARESAIIAGKTGHICQSNIGNKKPGVLLETFVLDQALVI
jgi:hypothetical protein